MDKLKKISNELYEHMKLERDYKNKQYLNSMIYDLEAAELECNIEIPNLEYEINRINNKQYHLECEFSKKELDEIKESEEFWLNHYKEQIDNIPDSILIYEKLLKEEDKDAVNDSVLMFKKSGIWPKEIQNE